MRNLCIIIINDRIYLFTLVFLVLLLPFLLLLILLIAFSRNALLVIGSGIAIVFQPCYVLKVLAVYPTECVVPLEDICSCLGMCKGEEEEGRRKEGRGRR
jgi:hypothetical protein